MKKKEKEELKDKSDMSETSISNEELETLNELNHSDDPTLEFAKEFSEFEKKYQKSREHYDQENYIKCAEELNLLFKELLVSIIDKVHRKLTSKTEVGKFFLDKINSLSNDKNGNNVDLNLVDLPDLCEVFDDKEIDIFINAEGRYNDFANLLKSFNFHKIVEIIDDCKNGNVRENVEYIKLGLQQALNLVTALLLARQSSMQITQYHLLANFSHIKNELERIRSLSLHKITKHESKLYYLNDEEENEEGTREFQWIKYRGTLVNPTDGSRNIAFKVETFVNIISTIFDGIHDSILNFDVSTKISKIEKLARVIPKQIIFKSGYKSGSKFGWTMQEILRKEFKDSENKGTLSTEQKIDKWCLFDSDVGFGKLSLKDYSERNISGFKEYSFTINLIDNFMVYKRDYDRSNLNSFIAGYIQGVLEKVIQQPLILIHNPWEHSQQFTGNDYCEFKLKTDLQKLKNKIKQAKDRYSDNLIITDV